MASTSDDAGGKGATGEKVSLAQAILAPLDALFRAQAHAARSFVNYLLQLSYGHQNTVEGQSAAQPYLLWFADKRTDGRVRRIGVPTLGLLPIQPLGIKTAAVDFEFRAEGVRPAQQIRRDAGEKPTEDRRPWFLVEKPLEIEGGFPVGGTAQAGTLPSPQHIRLKLELERVSPPPALTKVLSMLGDMWQDDTSMDPTAPRNAANPAPSASPTSPPDETP